MAGIKICSTNNNNLAQSFVTPCGSKKEIDVYRFLRNVHGLKHKTLVIEKRYVGWCLVCFGMKAFICEKKKKKSFIVIEQTTVHPAINKRIPSNKIMFLWSGDASSQPYYNTPLSHIG